MEELSTNTTATETTDNSSSELSIDEQIERALDEPVDEPSESKKTTVEETEPTQDNSIDCPDKFKNKDGSVNVENLAKSYKELEPLIAEKANWEKERAELLKSKEALDAINKQSEDNAKQAGFNSALDMQQSYQVAQFEANEYSKYLLYVDDETRQNVQNLLYQYANNPSADIMQQIEVEFAPEINKRIAVQADRLRQQFETEKQTKAETVKMSNIEDVISKSVEANNDLFNYQPFKELFVNTLHRFGDNFTFDDAKALMDSVVALKGLFEEEFKKASASNDANKKATDALAAITGQNSAPNNSSTSDKVDIKTISDSELNKLLDKYI